MMEVLEIIFLVTGSSFCFLASLGIARFPDFFMRLQALTKATTFGVGMILLAVMFHFIDLQVTALSLIVLAMVFITNPVSAHMLSRVAYLLGTPLWKETKIDELEGKYDFETHELQ